MTTTATPPLGRPYVKARVAGERVYISPEVSPKWQGVWTIAKVNPTTYGLERDGFRLKAPHDMVADVPEGMTATAAGTAQTVDLPAYRAPLAQGTVVRWDRAPAKARGPWFVVTRDDGDPRYVARLVRLGGDGDRRWGKVPFAALTVVDPATLGATS